MDNYSKPFEKRNTIQQSSERNTIKGFSLHCFLIRECGSTLYIGMAHASPPTQYKSFMVFLLTCCLNALLRDTPARSSRFQGQDNFPVFASTIEIAELRLIKWHFFITFIIIIIFFFKTIFSSDGFSLKCFYAKNFIKIPYIQAVCFSYHF